jgi:hypothetical protein
MARGLEERDEAMQRRARALAEQAIEQNQVWVRRLGIAPSDPLARERWIEAVTTVAAYRERWNIDDEHLPLGRKVQQGRSKRSTSAISPGLPSRGRRGLGHLGKACVTV